MNIIGIAGSAGAGKDAVADVLVKEFGFVRVALADVMKRFCQELFGWDRETLWGPSHKRNEMDKRFPIGRAGVIGDAAFLSPRFALQTLGTEWGKGCYENVWSDYAIRVAKELLTTNCAYDPSEGLSRPPGPIVHRPRLSTRGVVIPDVRFENEMAAIHATGGTVWKVIRPLKTANLGELNSIALRESHEPWRRHVSETSLDGVEFDRTIINDRGLDELAEAVRRTMRAHDRDVWGAADG